MSDEKLTLGIIRRPGYGMRDMHRPGLWFDVYVTDASAALQVFGQPEADKIIEAFAVYDVHDLEGRPCWVDISTPGRLRYEKPATLGAKR